MITKVEHIWSEKSDRWIYIEYCKDNNIIGLNYCQGGDYDYFKKYYCQNDSELHSLYNLFASEFPIEKKSISRLDFINKCLWLSCDIKEMYCKIN